MNNNFAGTRGRVADAEIPPGPAPTTGATQWGPLLTICLGTFMLLIDVSIVNVALPKMSAALNSSFTSLQWVVDIYALVLASLVLVAGSVGDRFGHRRLYLAGLVVFALGSLVCGLAPNAAVLIAARAVQGIGGAAMYTATTALLSAAYHGHSRGTAFGVWGAVNGGAAALGPILGGLLTEQFGWRSIFLVNLPVAAIAIVMSLRTLVDSPHRGRRKIDLAGAIAFSAFAAATTYALIESNTDGWTSATVLSLFAVAVVALIAFMAIELRSAQPLIDLKLLRRPAFAALLVGGLLLNAAAFAHLTYTSIWLQSVLGMSAIKAGLAVSPMSLTAFVVAGFGGRRLGRLAPRWPLGIGLALVGGGTLALMVVHANSSWTALVPGLLIVGVGVGMATPVIASAALSAVPHHSGGMAGGALITFRQLGYALGIAVLGTVFVQPQAYSGGALTAATRGAVATSLDHVFAVAGSMGLAAAAILLLLVRRPPLHQQSLVAEKEQAG